VVGLSGELDLATSPRLQAELRAVEASDAGEIVLDLADLSFIDSSGLRLIIGAEARSRANGKRLALRRAQAPVHRIFELTDTVERLPFAD
jgi:anti-anti-sigma factor